MNIETTTAEQYQVERDNGQAVDLGPCTRVEARKAGKVLAECWGIASVRVNITSNGKPSGFFKVSP